jgi:hypothetical protein
MSGFQVGRIGLTSEQNVLRIQDAGFCRLYYFNNIKRKSYGLIIDIKLNKEITLIKSDGFFYEFRPNKTLRLTRLLANLDFKTVKHNLNEFLFETQKIVLKNN